MRGCLLATGLGVAALGPVALLASGPPGPDGLVLVFSPRAAEVATLAGVQVIGPVRAPLAVLATGSDDDLIARLYRAGAWAVLDGGRVAALCGLGDENTTTGDAL